jgi:hypothetical protein
MAIAAVGLCSMLFGCGTARFDLYGKDAARTTADPKAVNRAVFRTHQKLAHYVDNADGSRSCPSFRSASQHWAVGATPDSKKVELSRVETSFDDADGKQVKIEAITVRSEPTLIFLTYDKPDGPLKILNELRKSLVAEGVKLD